MLFVLDSNEYIFTFGLRKKESCQDLLDRLSELVPIHGIRISRLIVREVQRNLAPEESAEFFRFLKVTAEVDEDIFVPFEFGAKYEVRGLKPADAFIAAYTEWVGADALVTENRHFLTRRSDLPFKILTAEQCLKFIAHSSSR